MINDQFDILIVDDEESIRRVVSQVLIDDGYRVTTAESGELAFDLILKRPFNLVITDIRMSGMSGMELLRKIRSANSSIEVVIITSFASLDTAVQAMRDGAYDYLAKPFESLHAISSVAARVKEKIRLNQEKNELDEKLRIYNSQLERANQELTELTTSDSLTNLFNKQYFQRYFEAEFIRSHRYNHAVSLLMVDVDSLQQYNETYGQACGDDLLRFMAELLRSSIRITDVACRYGGDEFVIIMPETTKDGAIALAEKIRKSVEDYPFEGQETQPEGTVTVSIGVAGYPGDGEEGSEIIQHVEEALLEAKNSGRNRVVAAGLK